VFVHQHNLEYLLRPEHYTTPAHLQLEIEKLFLPAWQFVAVKSELPRDGDFITLEMFDRPLLIRNFAGTFVAFENVCAHRHCQLTTLPSGHSPTLRCQYHGWEYDQTGRTARIPDARCFRPWDREHSHLNRYRLEECGDLLFVALNENLPSLRDWLGPMFDTMKSDFALPEFQCHWIWEYEAACNWKVPAENTLESYHVPALHQKFYGNFYPSEERSVHVLTPEYTQLTYLSDTRMEAWQARLRRWSGGTPRNEYVHRHIHPNLIVMTTDTYNCLWTYQPLTPRQVRIRFRAFALRGLNRDPITRLGTWVNARLGKRSTLQIHLEDLDVYPAQQRGLEASTHPGVIGTREERIYTFQKYVLDKLGISLPAKRVGT